MAIKALIISVWQRLKSVQKIANKQKNALINQYR